MKKLLVISTFILSGLAFGQYANDWIDYSQSYYSFKIWQDGVYRLEYNTLNSAGVPVGSIAPENFQIFGFEKEQEIFVEDGGDSSFDPGDYILFYAKKNTTWKDSLMYEDPSFVANEYYPHYNDTIKYFLSWNGNSNIRMAEESDVNFTAYTPQPYFFKKVWKEHHSTYLGGYKISGMTTSKYTEGEGWFSTLINAVSGSSLINSNLPSAQAYVGVGAPLAKVRAVSTGASNATYVGAGNHHLLLQYTTSNITIVDTIFTAYDLVRLNVEVPTTSLGAATTQFRHQAVNDLGVASDYQAVAMVEMTYPHNPNLENQSIFEATIPNNTSETKTRYDLINFNATTPHCFVLSPNIKKVPIIDNSGTFQVLIPNHSTSEDQNIVFFDEAAITDITTITPVNQGTGFFTDYAAMGLEDAFLMVTGGSLWNSTAIYSYRDHRESQLGGGFNNVILLDEAELSDQFGAGLDKSPWGIRNFTAYAYENTTLKPNNLFLIGKGIREANESVSAPAGTRQNPTSFDECIVPAWGFPASDILLTSYSSSNGLEPLIPTGRLAAKNEQEVQTYLNKVIEFELEQDPNSVYNVPDKLWQKQILHFGGGSTESEQVTFRNYLKTYESYMENEYFGGNVNAFYKTVSDPIDPTTLFEVTDHINRGVSVMTFFGHASADGFDQNVDDPSNWDNKGKYPLVVGNACLTGNIFEPTAVSPSENYVLIEDKGAIAFLSNVKQAFSNSLHTYSNELFLNISRMNYGESIGTCVKAAIDTLYTSNFIGFGKENVMTQMTLHGDPALRINPHERPELEVNNTSIFITPENVDLSVDSIDVNVVLYNLGKSTLDTFAIELTRTFPNNGGDSLYSQLVYGSHYIDTIVFTVPMYNNVGIGINEFCVSVDIPSMIDEQYDEVGNNQVCRQVIFDVDGIYPVWPYEFAVVPKDTIILKGSTVNPFADIATYRFEIDTTDLFNSPMHRFSEKTSLGGVVEVDYDEWINVNSSMNDPLILEDSMVYFWRVSAVDTGYYWIESSFQHINGKTGWGQEHFFQFKNNDFLFLDYDRPQRKRLFGPAFKVIDADVYGNATSWLETAFTLYHIEGEIAEYNFCTTTPQLLVAVMDPVTLEPWGTYWDDGTTINFPNNDFGNHNNDGGCRNRVEWHFSFWQSIPTELDAFDNMIMNEIPDSHYILIYTARFADLSQWDQDNFNTFASLGVDSLTIAQNGDSPFILFTKKGNLGGTGQSVQNGGTNFTIGDTIDSFITFQDTLWGFDFFGTETSPIIGPAESWETLYWRLDSMETPTDDSTRLLLYGVEWSGAKTLLMDSLLLVPHDSIIDLQTSLIDASAYPFMQLAAYKWDKSGFTPSQLDGWHVLYEDVPEAALDGSAGVFISPGDSLYEGQDVAIAFDIDNISDLPMDSLLVNYWIEDADHSLIPIPYSRQDSLRVGETIRDTININSENLAGLNSIWVEVNPYVNGNEKDQIEKYHFNNLGQIPIRVADDDENPILDVTFNGYHILNGDIVDPYSEIVITLKDDNPYLIMDNENDTANFGIYLTDPNGNQIRWDFRNAIGEPQMEWVPADASNRKFKIIKQSSFDLDGEYRLLVQGVDKSGNISGDFEYDIEFNVDHNSSITNLMNYPNPFTTSTKFVFTLTGSVVPDEFTIQIMNVSGTVVREITRDELGDIQIGRNITDFEWDGTDEYGDQLARGVYLYRVIVKINGEDVDHRESGADQYFTKSFGKMFKL